MTPQVGVSKIGIADLPNAAFDLSTVCRAV
jgi:hypothetical protein